MLPPLPQKHLPLIRKLLAVALIAALCVILFMPQWSNYGLITLIGLGLFPYAYGKQLLDVENASPEKKANLQAWSHFLEKNQKALPIRIGIILLSLAALGVIAFFQ